MNRARTRKPPRGAALVEAAITLPVFVLLIFGLFDLGLCTFRYHALSNAARQGARKAVVHGNLTPRKLSTWGPKSTTVVGSDGGEVATEIRPFLGGMSPKTVSILMEWPDGDCAPESRVRVTLSTTHPFLLTSVFGGSPRSLTASSTMRITH